MKLFLDLIGLFGVTPALNGYMNVVVHTANAYCLLPITLRHSDSD